MSDNLTPEKRSRIMSSIHSSSTKPEIKLRGAVWRLGFRYKINDNKLPGKPDIVLPKYRTVIFVHGCFWHGHEGCPTSHIPETNVDFWTLKIARNQERDQDVWRQLEAKGWYVIIVWECQLKKAKFQETVEAVTSEIRLNGEKYRQERENRRASREAYCQERKAREEKASALMAEIKGL